MIDWEGWKEEVSRGWLSYYLNRRKIGKAEGGPGMRL